MSSLDKLFASQPYRRFMRLLLVSPLVVIALGAVLLLTHGYGGRLCLMLGSLALVVWLILKLFETRSLRR